MMRLSRAIVWIALTFAGASFAQASDGDARFDDVPYLDGLPGLQVGDGSVAEPLSRIIERGATLQGSTGETLLPGGTSLESAWFDAGMLRVRLHLGSDQGLRLDDGRSATLTRILSQPFVSDPAFRGVTIEVAEQGGAYHLLNAAGGPDAGAASTKSPAAAVPPGDDAFAAASLGGPVAHGDGQPAGALSGVVVFVAAGHGWTNMPAEGSTPARWGLQRPLLLDMNEDYANLDQINYFIQYLYNAGATVVPFRPVGYQTAEVVLDNDDPGVTFTGSWAPGSGSIYYEGATVSGVRYQEVAAYPSPTATARYTPTLPSAGFYPVYCWAPATPGGVPQKYAVTHSGGTAVMVIDHGRIGSGWIWLGNYYFEAGSAGHVEISNESSATGTVIADAIRFGNGIGDTIGRYSSTLSGYSREEEGALYWAKSEAQRNAVGLPANIWDCDYCGSGATDQTLNTGTAARWAKEMNIETANRWRRAYLEFHTNAAGCTPTPCGAQGTIALVHSSLPTTNQNKMATLMGDKLEADLIALSSEFEYPWVPRANPSSGVFGAISSEANGNEFDATLLELAFHDNIYDAANLRSAKVRDAIARSTLQGLIRFLSDATTFPGTQVPNIFPPDAPERVRAHHDGSGNVVVAWDAPTAGPGGGGTPAGYRVYRSSNGYGFGQPVDAGAALSVTLTDVPAETTVYLRVAAYNAGGESMPTRTIGVRRPAAGAAQVLLVDGYNRVSRHQNPIQQTSLGSFERQIPRRINSFDYAVQHGSALDVAGVTFDACSNEAVISGAVTLGGYQAVVWILGRESSEDKTFDSTERSLLATYLDGGGALFVSGTDIGNELDLLDVARTFYREKFGAICEGDNSNATAAIATGGVLDGMGAFDFSAAGGAPYTASLPDRILHTTGARNVLTYTDGTGGGAGIEYDAGAYRLMMLAFPFETIGSASVRSELMTRAMDFLLNGYPAGCRELLVSGFEGYVNSSVVMFRVPNYALETKPHLVTRPNVATVTTEVPGAQGIKTYKLQWRWVDATPARWLRLVTEAPTYVPNPTIDLRRPVRLRLRMDSGSFRLSLGIRETGSDVPVGGDGGTTGTVEWVGATSVASGVPQGVLVTGQPDVWQTITFVPSPATVQPNTGDGVLSAPNSKGVIESLAFASNGDVGPFTVYLDTFDQPCSPRPDLDVDGDVDGDDLGAFMLCAGGPNVPVDPACATTDLDSDGDADMDDFGAFQRCFSGAWPANPACEN